MIAVWKGKEPRDSRRIGGSGERKHSRSDDHHYVFNPSQ